MASFTIALIVSAAVVIRLQGLGDIPLWTDEAMTLVLVEGSFFELWFTPFDPTPPIYYTIHKLIFNGTIPDAFYTRMPSLVYGVIAVGLILALGRLAHGPMTGLFAGGILAVQTYHVIYSQEARAYGLLFTLVLASALALTLVLRRDTVDGEIRAPDTTDPIRRKWLFLYALIAIVAHYTHYVSLFWTAFSFAALVLWESWPTAPANRPALWRGRAKLGALIALATIPTLMFMTIISMFWIWLQHVSFGDFIISMRHVFFLSELNQPLLDLALALLVIFGLVRAWRLRSPAAPVITVLLLIPLAMWLTGYVRPVMMERTILFSISGVVLALALAVDALPRAWLRIPAALAIIALYAVNTQHFLKEDARGNRGQDWNSATRLLLENVKPGDAILMCGPWYYPAIRHLVGDRLSHIPFYAPTFAGRAYRLDKTAHNDARWTISYLKLTDKEKGGYFDKTEELGHYPRLWGLRLGCVDENLDYYNERIAEIGGKHTQIWTGNRDGKMIPGTYMKDWNVLTIHLDRIDRPAAGQTD